MAELRGGIVNLDQQENNPYMPYINLILGQVAAFMDMLRQHPDMKTDDLRPHLTALIKLDTNKDRSKRVAASFPTYAHDRAHEARLIALEVTEEEYQADPNIKAKVDGYSLPDTPAEKAKRLALIDQFGLFITEYIGPKFDVDGWKMCIMISSLRNDQDMLLSTRDLTQEERKKLSIHIVEKVMQDEYQ